jgi:hypothetical protein
MPSAGGHAPMQMHNMMNGYEMVDGWPSSSGFRLVSLINVLQAAPNLSGSEKFQKINTHFKSN